MIGQGVYTLSEVSRYTSLDYKLPRETARTWFKPRSDLKGRGPVFQSDYEPVGGDFAVSFLNFVDAYVASFFRRNFVKPKVIRRAHQLLQAKMRTSHPFAHAKLSTDGIRIIHEEMTEVDDAELIDVISQQLLFSEFTSRLTRLRYDVDTRLAYELQIATGVVMNPRLSFGKPVVQNTGVSTYIIARQYVANNKDAALVARLFKITEAGVLNAYQFENSLGRAA
ncbi:MAG: hypothetical protein QOF78_3773 [Phycisphaerales bacterium]|jgi:uncharacterized protein (DUF433 family)|nr:hypothetical protein [Phycisphaerales bacterium]